MNYIELINNFWQLDEYYQFTAQETRLFFYLVKTANYLNWQKDFWHSDDKAAGNNGMSINTLKTARERIVAAGLIGFTPGGHGYGNKTRYQILTPKQGAKLKPIVVPITGATSGATVEPLSKLNSKDKLNSKSHSDGQPSAPKKKSNDYSATPYWKAFVDCWDVFYSAKKSERYLYLGRDFAALKKVYDFLKKRADAKQAEFTEKHLIDAFNFFLEKAWAVQWLRENLSIPNILSQFNQIANGTGKAASGNGKQANGPVDTGRAFDKINSMPGSNGST